MGYTLKILLVQMGLFGSGSGLIQERKELHFYPKRQIFNYGFIIGVTKMVYSGRLTFVLSFECGFK